MPTRKLIKKLEKGALHTITYEEFEALSLEFAAWLAAKFPSKKWERYWNKKMAECDNKSQSKRANKK